MKEWAESQGYATEAWVNAQGFLDHSYVPRGDVDDNDWNMLDFGVEGY